MHRPIRLLVVGPLTTVLLLEGALAGQVASAQCADPRGNAYCKDGGLVQVQNPNPLTNVDVQNPNGGDSGAQNPNAPIATATTGQLTVLPDTGAPGDFVAATGEGFGARNLMFLNVVDSAGQILDTDSRAYTCQETDDWVLVLYQTYGLGCTSGARPGPLNQSNPDGTFTVAVQIPVIAVPGPAQLCAKGVFATSCTPITIAVPNG